MKTNRLLIILLFLCSVQIVCSQQHHATARVTDGYATFGKISVVYEDGTTESIPLQPYKPLKSMTDKLNSAAYLENQVTLTTFLNNMESKGYSLDHSTFHSHYPEHLLLIFSKQAQ